MRIKRLYKFIRSDGGVTVSTVPPENGDHTEMVRMIADEGFVLTDGFVSCLCVDADSTDGWSEEISAEEMF